MAVSLESIYYTAMRKYGMKLVAGAPGIWNIVDWIHTVEDIALIDFLKGDELVILTGIDIYEKEKLYEYTKKIIEVEASGLVFNIGPNIESVTDEIIALAEENNFPIFTLPWEVRLVEFNREFCNAIFQSEQNRQNLCSAFKNAIFSPLKTDSYLPHIQKEGFSVDTRYCMVKCMPVLSEDDRQYDSTKLYFDLRLYVECYLNSICEKHVIFRYGNYINIIIPDTTKKIVEEVIVQIANFSKWQRKKGKLYFAVSDYQLQIEELSECFEPLALGCQLAEHEDKQVYFWEDMGIFSVLFAARDTKVLKSFKKYTIGSLEEYDKENGTNYCNMLYFYLKYNGNMQMVAKKCFLHRNTVSYHLKKIENILQCDIYSTVDRVQFYLALSIKEILKL